MSATEFKTQIVKEEIDSDGLATISFNLFVDGEDCGQLKMEHDDYRKFVKLLKQGASAFSHYFVRVRAEKPRMEVS